MRTIPMTMTALMTLLFMAGCSSRPQQQPTAAEQKQIQQQDKKTQEEMRQLTSGEGNSMLNDGSQQQSGNPNQKQIAPQKNPSPKQQKADQPQH